MKIRKGDSKNAARFVMGCCDPFLFGVILPLFVVFETEDA